MEEILKCNKLNKSFGKKHVLKDVSFSIEKGDILAFIGPNGSGKTTTIKLILGLQSIDSGNVIINNYDIKKDFVKAIEKVGAIVENPDVYMYLTGYQNLKLYSDYYKDISDDKINHIIKIIGLEKQINEKVSKYSLGMRQRLGIGKALLNDPNLLILDEPTNGLDPEGIKNLRELLKKLAQTGIGILISSHNLAELENFCTKVCVIKEGSIIETSNVKDFTKDENKYFINVNDTKNIKGQDIYKIKKDSFYFKGNTKDLNKLIKYLIQENIEIYEIRKIENTLEEAFLKKTTRSIK